MLAPPAQEPFHAEAGHRPGDEPGDAGGQLGGQRPLAARDVTGRGNGQVSSIPQISLRGARGGRMVEIAYC